MRKLKELKENWTHRLQFLIVFLKHWMLKKLLGRILVEKEKNFSSRLFPNPELYWIKLIQSEKIICKKKKQPAYCMQIYPPQHQAHYVMQ